MARITWLQAVCLCALLALACCALATPASGASSRTTHPIFSSARADAGRATHRSKHVRRIEVLESFHFTHGEEKAPLAGFHPEAPPVPKPEPVQMKKQKQAVPQTRRRLLAAFNDSDAPSDANDDGSWTLDLDVQDSAEQQSAGSEEGSQEEQDDTFEFSDSDLAHWTVAGAPHKFHSNGLAQLFPDRVTLHVRVLGQEHVLKMNVMHDLFHADSRVQVYDAENELIESRAHVIQSYWYISPDGGSEWATATLHRNGQFQAIIHTQGDTIQIDPVQMHKQEMEKDAHYDRLHRAAHYSSQGDGARHMQKGMVAFKHSDMPNLHLTHRCGHLKVGEEDQHRNGTVEETTEPLLPYTASARRLLQTSSATTQGYGNFPTSTSGILGWTNCFTGDTTNPQRLSVGFAVDAGMYAVWGSVVGVQQYLAWQMSVTNIVYLTQVRVFLTVSDVIIQTALGAGTPAWNDAPPSPGAKCPTTIQTKLNTFGAWRGSVNPTRNALWQLQTNCYPPAGTVGLAWINVLCNTYYAAGISTFSSNQWLTTAHEFGHNFGAQHTFQLGQGTTGGIMDYGDGRLNNIFQFNTQFSQGEMCGAIKGTAYATSFSPYCVSPYRAVCGNGIVEPGEKCDDSSPCCSGCQLVATAQCSGETPCCTGCQFRPTTTSCMSGKGLCQNGFCAASACQGFGGMYFCGLEPTNPCRQRCQSSTTACTSGYTSPNLNIPDGVVCGLAPYRTCQGGTCVATSGGGGTVPVVTYSWTTSAWTTCSCTGSQTRSAYCTGSDGTRGVEGTNCPTSTKPNLAQTCTIPSSCTTYSWQRSAFSTCSVNCGTGIQVASVQCVSSTGAIVADSSCTATRPSTSQSCNTQACPVAWVYSSWSACSVGCGGGISTRTATCMATQNGITSAVTASSCSSLAQTTSQTCNTQACVVVTQPTVTFSLTYGTWGACSVTCGPNGQQTRPVYCVGSDGKYYDTSFCGCGPTTSQYTCPLSMQTCNSQACPSYAWRTSDWGTCSLTCGSGIQTRTVQCVDQSTGAAVSDTNCVLAKPSGVQSCNTQACSPSRWSTGSWSACSKSCGGGTQTRSVTCMKGNTELPDSSCASLLTVPQSTQSCNLQACPSYQWLVSGWSTCSSWCGGGTQTRSVKCVAVGSLTAVSYSNCDTSNIPATAQYCNTDITCPLDSDVQWKLADWSSCSSICGGNSVRNRTVLCTNTTTGLEVDPKFCPSDYRPETSSLCPDVKCPTYWHTTPWTGCTASCAGGRQERKVTCRYMGSNESDPAIDDALCTGTRPAQENDCNLYPCPTWQPQAWNECSARCGDGFRNRTVLCVSWDNQNVSSEACAASPLPVLSESCNTLPCPHWHRSPWSYCDAPCGGGNQTRSMVCRMPHGEPWRGQLVPDETLCPAVGAGDVGDGVGEPGVGFGRPAAWRLCNTLPCPNYYWEVIKWSACSASCSGGTQSGVPVCKNAAVARDPADEQAGVVSSNLCLGDPPETSRACNVDPCPVYGWIAPHEWGACSVKCGSGTQTREVLCANTKPAAWKDVPYEVQFDATPCQALPKIPTVQACYFARETCYGTQLSSGGQTSTTSTRTSLNGLCTAEGTCLCRAGWAGEYCDQTPVIHTVLTNGVAYGASGIPLGDTLQISWASEGSLPYVSLLLTRAYPSDANEAWPVPLYFAKDIINTGSYSWSVGDGLPEELMDSGEGFVVIVWFSPSINAQNLQSFRIADPCDYKDCGVHGTCGRGGVCECVRGFSGDTCSLGPCERAQCSTSYGSCLNEDYIGSPDVTETTLGVCLCGEDASGEHYDGFQCRSPPSCTPRCKNGADLVNVVIDLNGKTDESKGQCGTCACRNLWGGDDCDTCGLQCFNGGVTDDDCSRCDCTGAPGFFGTTCACKYYSLTLRLDLTGSVGARNPASWIGDALSRKRFAATLATDLALAAGQVSGVNVEFRVVDLRQSDPLGQPFIVHADVEFGLECPQLSADVVLGSSASTGSSALLALGQAQSAQGNSFNNLLSSRTIKDVHSSSYFPMRAQFEAQAAVSGAAPTSSSTSSSSLVTTSDAAATLASGPHPDVVVTNGRPSLLSVYNIVASALEDLSSPFYRGVITSSLKGAAVTSVTDLSGQDRPRVPGAPQDPFLAAAFGRPTGEDASSSSSAVSKSQLGIILGSVLGAVLVILLILAGVVLYRRRKADHRVSYSGPAESAVGLGRGGGGGTHHMMMHSLPPSADPSPACTPPRTPPPERNDEAAGTGEFHLNPIVLAQVGDTTAMAMRGRYMRSPSAPADVEVVVEED